VLEPVVPLPGRPRRKETHLGMRYLGYRLDGRKVSVLIRADNLEIRQALQHLNLLLTIELPNYTVCAIMIRSPRYSPTRLI
jgi:hypothetical protein